MNHLVRYTLAVTARRHGIQLIAAAFQANHYHLLLRDPRGELDAFTHDFDQLVARALNAHYGRGEAFWVPGGPEDHEIHDAQTCLEQLVYLFLNCVKDGMVERPERWPGFQTLPRHMGTFREDVERPEAAFFGGRRPADWQPTYEPRRKRLRRLFREGHRLLPVAPRRRRRRRSLPEIATLEFAVPPWFEDMPLDQFHQLVDGRLEERLEEIYEQRRAEGKTAFMGAAAVRNQNPFASAGDTFPSFERNPRIACNDQERRVMLLAELSAWRAQYRLAREAWQNGQRSVEFPWGTSALRLYHGVRIARPPDELPAHLVAA